jgi:hypothetical protein
MSETFAFARAAALCSRRQRRSGRPAARLAANLVRMAPDHPGARQPLHRDSHPICAGSATPHGRLVTMTSAPWRTIFINSCRSWVSSRSIWSAHDWGGPVAYAYACAHPAEVHKLASKQFPLLGMVRPARTSPRAGNRKIRRIERRSKRPGGCPAFVKTMRHHTHLGTMSSGERESG